MKTTIEMAREAGLERGGYWEFDLIRLERFAALVRADEREALMQLFTDPENQPSQYGTVTLDYHLEKLKEWEDRFEKLSDRALAQPEIVQVSPLEFMTRVEGREEIIGKPIFWAQWPNKEKT